MKKKLLVLMSIVFAVSMMILMGVSAAGSTYRMSDAVWGEQNSNGWSYYSHDGSQYALLDYSEDGNRFLDDSITYLELYVNGGHPAQDSAYSAVRAFTTPLTGEVKVTWEVAPTNASYYLFDGVAIKALKGAQQVFPDSGFQIVNDPQSGYPSGGDHDPIATPEVFEFEFSVTAGDVLYFYLNNNEDSAYGRTVYDITIEYMSVETDEEITNGDETMSSSTDESSSADESSSSDDESGIENGTTTQPGDPSSIIYIAGALAGALMIAKSRKK